jgi:hypothetical protein
MVIDGILAVLAVQDGLISSAQAAELGMSASALRRRVRDKGWGVSRRGCSLPAATR